MKDWGRSAFEATPILYDGTLYFTSGGTDVIAVNAASGALRWRHDSRARRDLHYSDGVSRGVSLWVDDSDAGGAACHARIYATTLDGRFWPWMRPTAKPVWILAPGARWNFSRACARRMKKMTSGGIIRHLSAAILDGKVIIGSSIGDNRAVLEELVAFELSTPAAARCCGAGPIPRDAADTTARGLESRELKLASAANAWAPLSVDQFTPQSIRAHGIRQSGFLRR